MAVAFTATGARGSLKPTLSLFHSKFQEDKTKN